MTKAELKDKLKSILDRASSDQQTDRDDAIDALLDYVGDLEIRQLFFDAAEL